MTAEQAMAWFDDHDEVTEMTYSADPESGAFTLSMKRGDGPVLRLPEVTSSVGGGIDEPSFEDDTEAEKRATLFAASGMMPVPMVGGD